MEGPLHGLFNNHGFQDSPIDRLDGVQQQGGDVRQMLDDVVCLIMTPAEEVCVAAGADKAKMSTSRHRNAATHSANCPRSRHNNHSFQAAANVTILTYHDHTNRIKDGGKARVGEREAWNDHPQGCHELPCNSRTLLGTTCVHAFKHCCVAW